MHLLYSVGWVAVRLFYSVGDNCLSFLWDEPQASKMDTEEAYLWGYWFYLEHVNKINHRHLQVLAVLNEAFPVPTGVPDTSSPLLWCVCLYRVCRIYL